MITFITTNWDLVPKFSPFIRPDKNGIPKPPILTFGHGFRVGIFAATVAAKIDRPATQHHDAPQIMRPDCAAGDVPPVAIKGDGFAYRGQLRIGAESCAKAAPRLCGAENVRSEPTLQIFCGAAKVGFVGRAAHQKKRRTRVE